MGHGYSRIISAVFESVGITEQSVKFSAPTTTNRPVVRLCGHIRGRMGQCQALIFHNRCAKQGLHHLFHQECIYRALSAPDRRAEQMAFNLGGCTLKTLRGTCLGDIGYCPFNYIDTYHFNPFNSCTCPKATMSQCRLSIRLCPQCPSVEFNDILITVYNVPIKRSFRIFYWNSNR